VTKIFSQLAVVACLMIIVATAGIYNLTQDWISQAKRATAVSAAETFTLTLSAQLDLINKMLDKMASSPEVVSAVMNADANTLNTVAHQLQNHFPEALKISLLPLSFNSVDANNTGALSFADLNMVRETFKTNQLPEIHGDENATTLAITRQIKQDKQVVGVVLLNMNYEFINKSLRIAAVQNGYIELKQDKRLLISAGNQSLSNQNEIVQTKITNGNWDLYYYYDSKPDVSQITVIVAVIAFPILITLVCFLIGQRRLSGMIKRDLDSVIQASKDILKKKPQGSYPIVLKEMSGAIFDLLQFKRVLEHSRQDKIVIKDEFEQVDPSDFFDE
jgi:phosphomannomutase/phosphoglucomutase